MADTNFIVEYPGRVGIRIVYSGPTNTKSSRWRINRADGTYNDDPDRLTISYESGLDTRGNVINAVEQYLANKRRKDKHGEGWPGRYVIAACAGDEYIATWIGADL